MGVTQIDMHPCSKVKYKGVSRVKKMTTKKKAFRNQKKPLCEKRKRARYDDLSEDYQVKNAVMDRAMEIQANLSPEFPTLVKYMLPSHVTGGFWLGLCKKFCQDYLPKKDTIMVLEDEDGEEFETKYLAVKVGLSAGWRGFSIAHKLLEGDVVVFQLVRPTKFKVYIVRCSDFGEVNGTLGLLELESGIEPVDAGMYEEMDNMTLKEMMLTLNDISQDSKRKSSGLSCGTNLALAPISHHSESDIQNLATEDWDGCKLSGSVMDFKEVKSIDDFSIIVNGLIIDSELSDHHRIKYYELCRCQNSFLHERLLGGVNSKLAAGVIAETINIADAIRASKLFTTVDNFITWGTTLKAFEVMGMNVGFLQERLDHLVNLSLQSKRYSEAKCERDCAEDEKKKLEAKLFEMNRKLISLDTEIKTLEVNGDRLELMFDEVAKAPWW